MPRDRTRVVDIGLRELDQDDVQRHAARHAGRRRRRLRQALGERPDVVVVFRRIELGRVVRAVQVHAGDRERPHVAFGRRRDLDVALDVDVGTSRRGRPVDRADERVRAPADDVDRDRDADADALAGDDSAGDREAVEVVEGSMASEPARTIAPAPAGPWSCRRGRRPGRHRRRRTSCPSRRPARTGCPGSSWTPRSTARPSPRRHAAPPSMMAVATLVGTSNRNDAPMPPLPPSAPNGSTRPRRAPLTDLFVLMLSWMFFQSVSPFLRTPARFRLSPPTPTTPMRCISMVAADRHSLTAVAETGVVSTG